MKRMLTLLAVPLIALLDFALDQWSKTTVQANLEVGQSWMPVDAVYEWLRVTHVRNSGAAFGMFPWANGIFMLIAAGVMIGVVRYAYMNRDSMPAWVRLSLGLMLGGISGNLIDRLRFGTVTDFIDFGYHANWWPVFNVADSSVVVGVTLLAIYISLQPQPQPQQPAPPSPTETGAQ